MFVFGHVGLGRLIVGPRGRALPVVPLIIGTLLPDIIDKPAYYVHLWDYISCTRTFGHTGILLAILGGVALAKRSHAWTGVALGVATHLLFDGLLDLQSSQPGSALIAATWPFLSAHFAVLEMTPLQQLRSVGRIDILITEVIGMALLWREYKHRTTRASTVSPTPPRTG